MPILDGSRHLNIVKGCQHSLVKITKKNPITNPSCNGETLSLSSKSWLLSFKDLVEHRATFPLKWENKSIKEIKLTGYIPIETEPFIISEMKGKGKQK